MKHISLLIILLFIISCGKDKIVELPEINNSNISELNDVSAAYLFYDESNPEEVELNRKNLISTTNWLVNVDKRLSLKQVIPQIKFLQEKKQNSQHKNEKAKNYFTCNDVSKKTLGFMEFTNVIYSTESSETHVSKISDFKNAKNFKSISFNLNGEISILNPNAEPFIIMTSKDALMEDLKKLDTLEPTVYLNFNENLSFQDYITYKEILQKSNLKYLKISNQEFLHN
jgi:biopolymer transport protein ExbD